MKKIVCLILALCLCLGLTACGEKAPSADLAALYESYGPILPEMFYLDQESMMNFLGIDTENCVQFQVAICAEGMRTDEVWLIEAKDQAALDDLTQLAKTRIESKLDETVTYAPDQYPVVQEAELLTNGLYLALLISPEVETMKAGFEAAFQK